jgi:hypothetical protein
MFLGAPSFAPQLVCANCTMVRSLPRANATLQRVANKNIQALRPKCLIGFIAFCHTGTQHASLQTDAERP